MITSKELQKELDILNYWQFGDWTRLAKIEIRNGSDKHIALKACAEFQLGKVKDAQNTLASLAMPISEKVKRILVSGVLNTLGKARYIIGHTQESEALFADSINTCVESDNVIHAIQARKAEQLAQLSSYTRWINFDSLNGSGRNKKLFIDCGGHDGCSTIKFKLLNPNYDVITFEGNPELWPYYENLPTQLIKKLVSDYNGEVEFIIDPVDADGSSIIKEKNIDYYKKIKNEDCPLIVAPCVDLSEFVKQQSEHYEEIVLKLDVEGAEYSILKKMIKDGTVKHIKKLYAEFHWNKINFPEEEHNALLDELHNYFEIEDWDAAEFQIHTKGQSSYRIRAQILSGLN